MSRVAFVNGAYQPLHKAMVSILDRGLVFGDAVYEVWGVRRGKLLDRSAHFARLHRSLSALRIDAPISETALAVVLGETMRRNRVRDGIVYTQIGRGAAARDHAFPSPPVSASIIVTAKNLDMKALEKRGREGVAVITAPETRWARRDIKSVNLLPNVLARQAAREAGAFEAWFVDAAGLVTEGTSSNAWIVDSDGALRTRPLSHDILHGVTRAAILQLAKERGWRINETAFTVQEAKSAREAFLSSASNGPAPITHIDGAPVADGRPGPLTSELRASYFGAGA